MLVCQNGAFGFFSPSLCYLGHVSWSGFTFTAIHCLRRDNGKSTWFAISSQLSCNSQTRGRRQAEPFAVMPSQFDHRGLAVR